MESILDSCKMSFLYKGSRRANHYTLTAIDAARKVQSFVKCWAYKHFMPSSYEIECCNTLDFFANPDAPSAEYTFGRIAGDTCAGWISFILVFFARESAFANIEFFGKFLKFAVTIAFAVKAIVGMVAQQKFNNGFAGIYNPWRMCTYFHPFFNRV